MRRGRPSARILHLPDFLAGLADRVRSLSLAESAVARRAFRLLLEGRPADRGMLVALTGLPPAAADAALDHLVEMGMVLLAPHSGALLTARGLSREPTPHRLELATRAIWASCAVDAVGIPAALGLRARVMSRCHTCRAPLALTVGRAVEAPPGVVIWAPDFDPRRPLRTYT